MSNKKANSKQTLFDVFRELASKAFNYPTTDMCSDGDVCTYLKHINVSGLCVVALSRN